MHILLERIMPRIAEVLEQYKKESNFHSYLLWFFRPSEFVLASRKYSSAHRLSKKFARKSTQWDNNIYMLTPDTRYILDDLFTKVRQAQIYIDVTRGQHLPGRYDAILEATLSVLVMIDNIKRADIIRKLDSKYINSDLLLLALEYFVVLHYDICLFEYRNVAHKKKELFYLDSGLRPENYSGMSEFHHKIAATLDRIPDTHKEKINYCVNMEQYFTEHFLEFQTIDSYFQDGFKKLDDGSSPFKQEYAHYQASSGLSTDITPATKRLTDSEDSTPKTNWGTLYSPWKVMPISGAPTPGNSPYAPVTLVRGTSSPREEIKSKRSTGSEGFASASPITRPNAPTPMTQWDLLRKQSQSPTKFPERNNFAEQENDKSRLVTT